MYSSPSPFLEPFAKYLTIRSQASGDADPSFVSEALREIESSDTPNQDIDMLKNVAVVVYMGRLARFTYLQKRILTEQTIPQREPTPQFQRLELFS
jgi:hypothetical protein